MFIPMLCQQLPGSCTAECLKHRLCPFDGMMPGEQRHTHIIAGNYCSRGFSLCALFCSPSPSRRPRTRSLVYSTLTLYLAGADSALQTVFQCATACACARLGVMIVVSRCLISFRRVISLIVWYAEFTPCLSSCTLCALTRAPARVCIVSPNCEIVLYCR